MPIGKDILQCPPRPRFRCVERLQALCLMISIIVKQASFGPGLFGFRALRCTLGTSLRPKLRAAHRPHKSQNNTGCKIPITTLTGKVDSDTEGGTKLVVTGVLLADGHARVVNARRNTELAELAGKLVDDLGELGVVGDGDDEDLDGRDVDGERKDLAGVSD